MTETVMPDVNTSFGARVAERLAAETVVWLTTVGNDGTPQPNPVWFIAAGTQILVYNRSDALRLRHIRRNPRVSLNFDGNADGGDIIVLVGRAEIVDDAPPCDANPAYLEKYAALAAGISGDVATFSAEYSVAMRIDIDRVRGF